jgi:MFS family permease
MSSGRNFYGWTNLAVTAIMGAIGGLYIVSFGMFLPFLVKDFGWNRGVASFASTISLIAMGVSGPLAGIFIMKYGARRSIILGNCLGFLGFVMLSFHSSLWELFLGFGVLVGLGAGFGGLLASTTVINNWFVKKRSMALSIFLGAGGAGGIVLGPTVMALINGIGWRKTFLIMAGLVFVFSLILPALLIRNKPQDIGQVPDGPEEAKVNAEAAPRRAGSQTSVHFTAKEAARTPTLWLLVIYFCLNMLAMQAIMTHMVTHLLDIGISTTLAATAMSIMSGVMTFTQFSVGFLGRRYKMHSIAIVAEVLKVFGIILLVLTDTLSLVFATMVVFGLGFGAVMVATMNMFPDYFGNTHYPKIMGLVRLFWTFAGGAGAPLAGWIREGTGSYLPAFQACIAIVAAGLICLIFAKAPVHPSLKKPQPAEVLL